MFALHGRIRRRHSIPVTAGLCGVVLLGIGPTESSAQSRVQIRATASAGLVDAKGRVPNAPVLDDPGAVLSYQDFAARPALGLGVELRAAAVPIGLRASMIRSLTHTETGTWGCGVDEVGDPRPCPSILIETPTDMTLSAATVSLVGDVSAGLVTVHPILGLGVQRWSYRWDSTPVGSFSLAPGTYRDDSITLYGGLALATEVGRLRLGLEFGEYRARASAARPDRVRSLGFAASVLL
ncbi:MAG: hypothetical protein OEN56_10240 [Gemmatimonadota bacterium]|nr:hypothetical protein [Gemmatimonadota bacterium]